SQQATVDIVDLQGHVVASADFAAPAPPPMVGCSAIAPPEVRVANGAAYFADANGVIHRLEPTGDLSTATTFRLSGGLQLLSYAVSPDGQHLMAIIVTSPQLKKPIPAWPA